ncbi:hypothetical protein OPV22_014408 [Ensete ventricosum]|uniref:Oleosin n=1 Tax=Ensete ventricosum TaxID=4639 RepID=A0AAV8RBE1_ENSVE|nr:hypothetical protein OPV22_014408 [Ensete ventricosum]
MRTALQTMGDSERERHPTETMKGHLLPEKGPSTSQALAVATLLPLGGGLLALAGLTLVGSLIGLAVLTPLLLLFSPLLVPAALLVALAATGFLASGAFGLTGLLSMGHLLNRARGLLQRTPEQTEDTKRRVGEVGQRARARERDAAQRT